MRRTYKTSRSAATIPETGIVTAIQFQKNRPSRCSVFIDGKFSAGLDAAKLVSMGIKKGQELTREQTRALAAESEYQRAKDKALLLLSRREHSQVELVRKLRKRQGEFSAVTITKVIQELSQQGLVDDLKFAKTYVRYRLGNKSIGLFKLRNELKIRGVKDAVILEALEPYQDEEAQEEKAVEAASKKLNKLMAKPGPKVRQKLFAFLVQQGFDYEVAQKVVRKLCQDVPRTNY